MKLHCGVSQLWTATEKLVARRTAQGAQPFLDPLRRHLTVQIEHPSAALHFEPHKIRADLDVVDHRLRKARFAGARLALHDSAALVARIGFT
jgi:hypothetical protein